jgi:hypothetical protein
MLKVCRIDGRRVPRHHRHASKTHIHGLKFRQTDIIAYVDK